MRSVLKSRIALIAVQGIGFLVGFVVTSLLARSLGASGYGSYALAVMGLTLLAIPIGRGWSTLVLRSASRTGESDRWSAVAGLLYRGRQLSLAFAGACLVLSSLVLGHRSIDLPWWLVPLAAAVLVLRQNSAFSYSLMRGIGYPVVGQLISMVVQPLMLALFLVAMLSFQKGGVTWTDALLALGVSVLLAYLITIFAQRRLVKLVPLDARAAAAGRMREWLPSAAVIGANAFLVTLFSQIDSYTLAAFTDSAAMGRYRIAVQIAALGGFMYSALNFLVAADFSSAWSRGKLREIEAVSARFGLLSLLFVLLSILLVAVLGRFLIGVVFGEDFVAAVPLVLILLIGQAVNAAVGMPAVLLTMAGREQMVIKRTIVALVVNAIVGLALVPWIGAYGAAVASVIGSTYLNVAHYFSARKHMHVNMAVWNRLF